MTIEVVSVKCGGKGPKLPDNFPVRFFDNTRNERTPCQAYQELLETSEADVIVYLHDDVTVHDPDWLARIMDCFYTTTTMYDLDAKPREVVAVGLGGATGLGNEDLYRKPYNVWNLARTDYASNQDDAETHGWRFIGTRRVAVLEQFCMAIRTEWLRARGGWPDEHLQHHMLDAFIACEAARDGKEIWQVGVSCLHSGGATSTTEAYAKASWLAGGSLEEDHRAPHRWIWDRYRDVLPIRIER